MTPGLSQKPESRLDEIVVMRPVRPLGPESRLRRSRRSLKLAVWLAGWLAGSKVGCQLSEPKVVEK